MSYIKKPSIKHDIKLKRIHKDFAIETVICKSCNQEKYLTEFITSKRKNTCNICYKNKKILDRRINKYGINSEDYSKIYKKQNGLCLICQKPEADIYGNLLAIDHDHKTGKVRGLLCRKCNSALGLLKDDINNIKRAVSYLRKNSK